MRQKTPIEQSEIMNVHFNAICREYPEFEADEVGKFVNDNKNLPYIDELGAFEMIKKFANKSGPGDLPRKILEEFSVELSLPYSIIVNKSISSGIFPEEYKKAEITPIPKANPPKSLSDFRPISKTPIGGKMIETVIKQELEKDVNGKIDKDQFGNQKGISTTHLLTKFMHEAFKSTDIDNATTAVTIDYSKAFDYVDHTILIEKLIALGVRKELINIIISFLKNRTHCTVLSGKSSPFLIITCGVPQGTCLGPLLFIILTNGGTNPLVSNFKYMDDNTLLYSYKGDSTDTIQAALDIESDEAKKNKMKINSSKCHAITFNFSGKNTEPKNLTLNGEAIQSCDKINLLGVTITKDLKWNANTEVICEKVNSKLYILGKLKYFGLKMKELVNFWKCVLRPLTEYASPLWYSGLTQHDIDRIESLQKKALGIICGVEYKDMKRYYKLNNKLVGYEEALEGLGLAPLVDRRIILGKKFALQSSDSGKHEDILIPTENPTNTRNQAKFVVPFFTKERGRDSAVPSRVNTLNEL